MRSNEISALKTVKYSTPGGRSGKLGSALRNTQNPVLVSGGAEVGFFLLLQMLSHK